MREALAEPDDASEVIPDSGKAVDEMKNSEDKFRVMVDAVPAFLWWWDPADGSNEFWLNALTRWLMAVDMGVLTARSFLNQRWYEYTGVSQEESRGSGWQVEFHPEDLVKVLDKWRAVVASGEPAEIEIEARMRRFDGEYRWFLIRAVPVRGESGRGVSWYGSSTDIEDRKRAEEKLRQDERELRRVTDAIPQTIVVQDSDGIPLYANQAVLD